MKDLTLFACPGLPAAEYVRAYEEALGPEVELRWIAPAGRSAVFTQVGVSARGADGRVLPGLLEKYAPGSWRSVSLITYSAGYGLARELLKQQADREALLGYVAIDSVHAGFEKPGVPSGQQLAPFVAYAQKAARGECLFVLAHTDVQTPQTGLDAFASTMQCSEALVKLVAPDGPWIVRAFDLCDDAHQMQEHGRALTAWGAPLVRETLAAWIGAWRAFEACAGAEEAVPDTQPGGGAPWLDPMASRGERALLWSLNEMHNGVREEPPGSNTGPRVRFYLAPCERAGKRLGLTVGAWCAASACAAELATRLPAEPAVHPYRAGGVEIEQDAKVRGDWRVAGPGLDPRRGDLAIYRRMTPQDPTGAYSRHVVRVEIAPNAMGAWRSLGGNEQDEWRLTERSLDDPALLGFVLYP